MGKKTTNEWASVADMLYFQRIKKRRIENGLERSKQTACLSCSITLMSFEGERVDGTQILQGVL